jgi:hypothetical protein
VKSGVDVEKDLDVGRLVLSVCYALRSLNCVEVFLLNRLFRVKLTEFKMAFRFEN